MTIKQLIEVSYQTDVFLNELTPSKTGKLYDENYVFIGEIHDIPLEYMERKIRSIAYNYDKTHYLFITLEPKNI